MRKRTVAGESTELLRASLGKLQHRTRCDGMVELTGSLIAWHTFYMSDTTIVQVGPKGRVVIPAGIRRQLGIEQGTQLTVLVDGEAVVLVPRDAVERRLRSIFSVVPASLADEVIEERRAEASAEA